MADVGLAIVGQTGDLVPADKLLYGLRDVTATVDQISLIAASIMSKKLAAGAQAIVLDVKVGDGAFMKTLEDAQLLAEVMLSLGTRAEREVVCLLTDMDQPLGAAVGNALEVREALETVRGNGPPDFTELVLDACSRLLELSDLDIDEAEGRRRAEAAVADGSAEAAWWRWIEAQGGTTDEAALPGRAGHPPGDGARPAATCAVWARFVSGTPRCTSARAGGRRRTRSTMPSASSVTRSVATLVEAGDLLAEIHARTEATAAEAAAEVLAAYELGPEAAPAPRGAARSRRVVEPRRANRVRDSAAYPGARHRQFGETRRTPVPGTGSSAKPGGLLRCQAPAVGPKGRVLPR